MEDSAPERRYASPNTTRAKTAIVQHIRDKPINIFKKRKLSIPRVSISKVTYKYLPVELAACLMLHVNAKELAIPKD
jgi:uncharacterized protein (DUF1499 family)